MSFTIEGVEEIMISDGHEDYLGDTWEAKLAAIDLFLTLVNAALLVILAFLNRFKLLKEQRHLFYVMVLFLTYQILSYLIVLVLSAIVYLGLCLCGKRHLAYSLTKLYSWLQSLGEFCILSLCAYEGFEWLWSQRLSGMTFHQAFFICMILTIAFKIARIVAAFCQKSPLKRIHMMYIGGQAYRVKHDTENKQRDSVIKMLAGLKDCQMVSEDQKVTVDGLEL